jgi:brefeldin A-resistance guanine nucleotide exchange factor 1
MQNSFPDPHKYSAMNYHVLCLDTLLMFIDHMVERVDYEVSTIANEYHLLTFACVRFAID